MPSWRSLRRSALWLEGEPLWTRQTSPPVENGCAPSVVTLLSVAIRVCPSPCEPDIEARSKRSTNARGSIASLKISIPPLRYIATPAESGPRLASWMSIAPRWAPRRSSTSGCFANNPTIPHMSEELEVAVELPLRDLLVGGLDLAALALDEVVEVVALRRAAERRADHVVALERAVNAVEAGGEQDRGREVRVAGAVDGAVLDAPGRRHAQHLRAVVVRVGDVHGRPRRARAGVADLEPLVGVHGRRRHRDVGLGVLHQAGDEVVRLLAQPQPPRVVIRLEHVRVAVPQAHVEVAAVAGQVRERLRHERRHQPALLRERLDHVAEEDRTVAGRERVGVLEVLLELPVRVLVVGRVDVPPERVDVARHVGHEP